MVGLLEILIYLKKTERDLLTADSVPVGCIQTKARSPTFPCLPSGFQIFKHLDLAALLSQVQQQRAELLVEEPALELVLQYGMLLIAADIGSTRYVSVLAPLSS